MKHPANKGTTPAADPCTAAPLVGHLCSGRTHARGGAAAVLIALALLALLAAPALALETHPFTGSIGPAGKAAGGVFKDLQAVTVDPATSDVYVLDTVTANRGSNGRLYRFDSSGEPLNFSATGTNYVEGISEFGEGAARYQVAVAPPGALGGTGGDIYVADRGAVKVFSAAGVKIGELPGDEEVGGEAGGVAVDSVGHVFVGFNKAQEPHLREYTPTANPVTEAAKSGQIKAPVEEFGNVAIDGDGRVYVSEPYLSYVFGSGVFELEDLTAPNPREVDSLSGPIAVEPGTNDLYADHGTEIVQYAAAGSVESSFGEGRLIRSLGVGIGSVGGNVYAAANNTGRVDVYGPLTNLPVAVAGNATNIERTSAVLHGTINPAGGPQAGCEFEFTTQATFESKGFEGATSKNCEPAGPFTGGAPQAVAAEISGLQPGVQYEFRLVASNEHGSLGSNENGSSPGKAAAFETPPAFAVVTGTAGAVRPSSVELTGSVNPQGLAVAECFFEYGPTESYGHLAPCEAPAAGEIGTGEAPVAVHAAVTGLAANAKYHFRLVATSAEFGNAPGLDGSVETSGPPRLGATVFSGVGQMAVTVSGTVDPDAEVTTYVVEYVTAAQFAESGYASATKVPVAAVGVGSGREPVPVSQELTGLVPGTTYHVRIAASNDAGSVTGADEVFMTHNPSPVFGPCLGNEPFRVGASAVLPDCRAYEQASPPNKGGGTVAGLYSLELASEDGSKATFYSPAATLPPGGGGAENYATYLMSRNGTAGSWGSQRLLLPEKYGELAEFLGTTPDLRYAVVEAGNPGEHGLFVLDTEDGSVTQISPYERSEKDDVFGFDGSGGDGERIFFESLVVIPTTPAVPSPVAGHDNLYVWDRASGDVSLVGVLPAGEGGAAPPAGSFGGAYEWYDGEGTRLGGALSKTEGGGNAPMAVAAVHAISPSGGQIFFTAAGTGQLYLRRGLDGGSPNTLRISAPNSGVSDPNGAKPAAFQEATPDGSRAFFMSAGKLTATSTTGAGDSGMDLYRWDAASESLIDLAPDRRDANGAEVQGLLGVNSTGTTGYFIARGALAPGAKTGQENLYRFAEEATGTFTIALVTVLEGYKGEDALQPDRRNVSPEVTFNYELEKTSRVSEDGGTLLFESTRPLTGYHNINPEGVDCAEGEGRCAEFYLYSAQTEKVWCVSCNPTGEAPLGAPSLQNQFFNAYLTPTLPPAVAFSRNLSADGTRVFFQSPDPLVAADTNGSTSCKGSSEYEAHGRLVRAGTARCQDVYEWEAVGTGSCETAEANGGRIYLLSSGQSDEPSYFIGAAKDGSNVFLATSSQLVPSDKDQATDVYDVRENGGLAAQYTTAPEPCTSTTACRGEATPPAPASLSLGSSVFSGPGNTIQTPPPPPPSNKPKPPTNTQLLAKALRRCRTKHNKTKRHSCERQAHKRYAPKKK